MNIQRLGTNYGGWELDLDMIPEGSTIIDAGVGEDISLILQLIRIKKVFVYAVDPTIKTQKFLEAFKDQPEYGNIMLIPSAISIIGDQSILMYKNSNPNHASDSLVPTHTSVGTDSYTVDTVTITDLIKNMESPPSLIKLDIEGTEYSVYDQCFGIPQVLIEDHSFCIPNREQAELDMVVAFKKEGYGFSKNKHNYRFYLE